jgi:hypothetical protein
MAVKIPNAGALDQVLGLRSWGLILYGALPACLSLLGFIEIKVGIIDRPILILLVSSLPLFVTFLLVRAREREWYFTDNYLNVRSAVTTLLIVLCSTGISGAAGLIRHKYDFSPTNLLDQAHMSALTECFLFGVASLVISSTLFATILTKGADLPGLPSSAFVSAVGKIRQQLIALQTSPFWEEDDFRKSIGILNDLNTDGVAIMEDLTVALSQPGHRFAKKSLRLRSLESDLMVFNQSVTWIKDGEIPATILYRWRVYLVDFVGLEGDELENLKTDRDRHKTSYEVLQRIRGLRLGG